MNKTIGEYIAELRRSRGLTQKELASILGVSDKAVSRWERDESLPDLYMAVDIADYFGISTDELLHRTSVEYSVKTSDPEQKTKLEKDDKIRLRDENAIRMLKLKYSDLRIRARIVCAVSVIAFWMGVILSDIDSDVALLFSFAISALLILYQIVTSVKVNGYIETRAAESEKINVAKTELEEKLYRTSAVSVSVIIMMFVLMLCWLHLGDWWEFFLCGTFFVVITALGCLILALIVKSVLKKRK